MRDDYTIMSNMLLTFDVEVIMSRFQAQTNAVLESELNQLQVDFGFRPNQKADLLRELASIASWVVQQSVEGRQIQAKGEDGVQKLQHSTLDRLRQSAQPSHELKLSEGELERLSELMSGHVEMSIQLKESLRRISSDEHTPPQLTWSDR